MQRISVIGDSWIKRLEKNLQEMKNDTRIYDKTTEWFGISGLTCLKLKDEDIIKATKNKPDIVIMHVGGNDLAELNLPTIIASNIMDIRRELLRKGAGRVLVMEVPPRELSRRRDYNRTPYTDDEKRWHADALRDLNDIMRSELGTDFIRITKKVKFPLHFSSDKVHLTPEGNCRFFFSVIRGVRLAIEHQ